MKVRLLLSFLLAFVPACAWAQDVAVSSLPAPKQLYEATQKSSPQDIELAAEHLWRDLQGKDKVYNITGDVFPDRLGAVVETIDKTRGILQKYGGVRQFSNMAQYQKNVNEILANEDKSGATSYLLTLGDARYKGFAKLFWENRKGKVGLSSMQLDIFDAAALQFAEAAIKEKAEAFATGNYDKYVKDFSQELYANSSRESFAKNDFLNGTDYELLHVFPFYGVSGKSKNKSDIFIYLARNTVNDKFLFSIVVAKAKDAYQITSFGSSYGNHQQKEEKQKLVEEALGYIYNTKEDNKARDLFTEDKKFLIDKNTQVFSSIRFWGGFRKYKSIEFKEDMLMQVRSIVVPYGKGKKLINQLYPIPISMSVYKINFEDGENIDIEYTARATFTEENGVLKLDSLNVNGSL